MRITSILKFKSFINTPIGANKKTRVVSLVFNYVSYNRKALLSYYMIVATLQHCTQFY